MEFAKKLDFTKMEKAEIMEKINDPVFFSEAAQAVFTEMDINENGFIEQKELYQSLYNLAAQLGIETPSRNDIDTQMAIYDKNGDGMLSREEFTPLAKKILIDILNCHQGQQQEEEVVEEIEEEEEH